MSEGFLKLWSWATSFESVEALEEGGVLNCLYYLLSFSVPIFSHVIVLVITTVVCTY